MKIGSITRTGSLGLVCGLLLVGCSTTPHRESRPAGSPAEVAEQRTALGDEIVRNAMSLLGHPYRYGGADPAGFDCSGLVRFVFNQLGVEVPRTVTEQYRTAWPVRLADLKAGDLLFFTLDGAQISHVAIYVGDGRFVHAPQTGRPVELRTLKDKFYRSRLVGAGRLYVFSAANPIPHS